MRKGYSLTAVAYLGFCAQGRGIITATPNRNYESKTVTIIYWI
jgi:hypothetical protein